MLASSSTPASKQGQKSGAIRFDVNGTCQSRWESYFLAGSAKDGDPPKGECKRFAYIIREHECS